MKVSAEDRFFPWAKHYHVSWPNLDAMGVLYSILYLGLITPFLTVLYPLSDFLIDFLSPAHRKVAYRNYRII